ncbi:MAG TPA: lasso peptide biosynthesis B2 protein [Candidatus Polarisedimenticolaceae bacterium]|nr:lasso peptide biosynthesis B2 protein [Candidatus Polarisedimenticolaceae bacterium]
MRSLRTLAAALLLTPLVAGALRAFGFRRTQEWMARRPSTPPPGPGGETAAARAREVARAAGLAGAHGPVPASCLRRALTAWWLLRREGIPVTIRIGVRREESALAAHAWIEHDGVPIGDLPSVVAGYAPFDADFARVPDTRP